MISKQHSEKYNLDNLIEQKAPIKLYYKVFDVWLNKKIIDDFDFTSDEKTYETYKRIFDNQDKITSLINEYYPRESTRNQHIKVLCVISRELFAKFCDKKYKRSRASHNQEMKKNLVKILDVKAENTEKYIEWSKVLEISETFKNIYNTDTKNYRSHIPHLLFSIVTKICPFRSQIYTSLIIKNYENLKENGKFIGNNKEHKQFNYITKYKNNYIIIINKDKVHKTYGSINILVDDPVMVKILDDSISLFPRTYLFENLVYKKNYSTTHIFNILLELKINFNMLRASFVTKQFDTNKAFKDRSIIANKMRHSVTIALQTYNRIKSITKTINDVEDDVIFDVPLLNDDENDNNDDE